MMLNSKCISLLPVAILASLIHVAIVNSYFIDSDQIAKRFDQIPEEQSLRDILTDDDSESDENEEFQNFDLEDPADHGSIPEVKKRTLVIQGIKHYKTSVSCCNKFILFSKLLCQILTITSYSFQKRDHFLSKKREIYFAGHFPPYQIYQNF